MKERVGDERLIIISVTVSGVNDRIRWTSDCYIDPWGPHLQSGSLIGHSHTQSPVRCFVSGGCKSHQNLEVSNVTCWHSAWNKPETSTDPYSHTHTHTCLTALCPELPGWAGTRKVKPVWILLKQETVSGSGISWAICKCAPRSRQIATPALSFFTGRMPFLPTNQQRQSTEGWAQSRRKKFPELSRLFRAINLLFRRLSQQKVNVIMTFMKGHSTSRLVTK